MNVTSHTALLALAVVLGVSVSHPAKLSGQGMGRETIRVGVFVDLSGRISSFGRSTLDGIKLAADEVNLKGGLLGRSIELIVEDDHGEPSEAARAAAKLIERNQVHALIGEVASSNTLAAAPIAQHSNVPLVAPAATHPSITQFGDYIFRACFVDPLQGKALAEFARRDLKARRAAILIDSTSDYSKSLATSFGKRFAELRGKVVLKQVYAQQDRDFMAQLVSIKSRRADVIFIPGYYQEVGTIIKQARQIGIRTPFLGGDGWDSPVLWDLGGRALNGSYISNHYSSDIPTNSNKLFTAAYQKHYGTEPDALAALGYDAMKMLVDAIRRAGRTEGSALRDALARTKNLDGVSGSITLNEQRDAIKPIFILRLENERFRYHTTVYPGQ